MQKCSASSEAIYGFGPREEYRLVIESSGALAWLRRGVILERHRSFIRLATWLPDMPCFQRKIWMEF